MKVLNIENKSFRVFDSDLSIDDKLPAGVYTIEFAQSSGYALSKRPNLTVTEKMYGKHEQKIDKILKSYKKFDRSMGVIFSGDKGIGKSIAARMLCEKMVADGKPVIIVDNNYPGLTHFIDSIQQECVVLFDEFEKNFKTDNDDDGDNHDDRGSQDRLLSLFDGTGSNIKRLYLVTCNNLWQLSDFLVNRPGRFHYHIRWNYPDENEITDYLHDKLDEKYYGEIEKVISFSMRVPLNYDCLRAISFELNMGYNFEQAIEDLNIMNINEESFDLHIRMKNGNEFTNYRENIDLFQKTERRMRAYGENECVSISFVPRGIKKYDGDKIIVTDFKVIDDDDKKDITNKVAEVWLETKKRKDPFAFDLAA